MAFELAVFLNGSQASCLSRSLLSRHGSYQAVKDFGLAIFLIPLLSHHGHYQVVMAFGLAVFLIPLLPHH
jgi:hypothetical protein